MECNIVKSWTVESERTDEIQPTTYCLGYSKKLFNFFKPQFLHLKFGNIIQLTGLLNEVTYEKMLMYNAYFVLAVIFCLSITVYPKFLLPWRSFP